jgi:hypothetical protein
MSTSSATSFQNPIHSHTHDDICIAVRTASPVDEDRRKAIYEGVRHLLNREIVSRLPPHGAHHPPAWWAALDKSDAAFERDITPSSAVWDPYDRKDDDLFAPMNLPDNQRAIVLERRGKSTTVLNHYRIVLKPTDNKIVRTRDAKAIRELVHLINRQIAHRPLGRDAKIGWQIVAATPNWLVNIAQSDGGGGGSPATPPRPVTIPDTGTSDGKQRRVGYTYRVKEGSPLAETELPELLEWGKSERAGENPVIVVVLDTAPEKIDLKAEAEENPTNMLLRQVAGLADPMGYSIEGDPVNPVIIADLGEVPEDFQPLKDFVPNWSGRLKAWNDATDENKRETAKSAYAMPDHGLFVAGITKSIAPRAEVRLIRMLDETGMGDIRTILYALRELPDSLVKGRSPKPRLIFNFSHTIAAPMNDKLVEEWFPEIMKDPMQVAQRLTDIKAMLDAINYSLAETINWLAEQGVLVVAAAGNDALREKVRPEPDLPARFDNVLGVASVNREGGASLFSNRGDKARFGNGVATYGGDAVRDGETPAVAMGKMKVESESDVPDAVIGIYTAKTLPFVEELPEHDGTNRSRYAYWTGTSFATPVISAIAALITARHPEFGPGDVINQIHDWASRYVPGLYCGAIDVEQVPVLIEEEAV